MPEACGPRNDGQLPLSVAGFAREGGFAFDVVVIFRGGLLTTVPAGNHVLPSRMIWRSLHSSETRVNLMCFPSVSYRYFPGPSQPPGPPDIANSISDPAVFQVPLSFGQPLPSSVSVPPGSKRAVKTPNVNGCEGNEAFDRCFSMYLRANSFQCGFSRRPIFTASASASSMDQPSRNTRPDHPKRADTNRGSAMDKRWTIFGIVGDLQKLRHLLFVWITERQPEC